MLLHHNNMSEAKDPAENRDAANLVDKFSVDASRADASGAERTADGDDNSDMSNIAAAVSAVDGDTRRTNRLARRLDIVLSKAS